MKACQFLNSLLPFEKSKMPTPINISAIIKTGNLNVPVKANNRNINPINMKTMAAILINSPPIFFTGILIPPAF